MKNPDLTKMTVDQLVSRFAEIGIAQDQATIYDDNKKFNRLFKAMDAVDDELRARGPKARLELLRLYEHPNIQVRLKAAVRTCDIASEQAGPVLEKIRHSGYYPQAANAWLSLDVMDGKFKLNPEDTFNT